MDDTEMTQLLSQISPSGRDVLRRLMRAEQFERDEFADVLARQPTAVSRDLADLLDLGSLHSILARLDADRPLPTPNAPDPAWDDIVAEMGEDAFK